MYSSSLTSNAAITAGSSPLCAERSFLAPISPRQMRASTRLCGDSDGALSCLTNASTVDARNGAFASVAHAAMACERTPSEWRDAAVPSESASARMRLVREEKSSGLAPCATSAAKKSNADLSAYPCSSGDCSSESVRGTMAGASLGTVASAACSTRERATPRARWATCKSASESRGGICSSTPKGRARRRRVRDTRPVHGAHSAPARRHSLRGRAPPRGK